MALEQKDQSHIETQKIPRDISRFPEEQARELLEKSLQKRLSQKEDAEEVSFDDVNELIDQNRDRLRQALPFELKKELPLKLSKFMIDDEKKASLLGKYELKKKIGSGGYGSVYEAYDQVLKREQVVKILEPDKVDDDTALENFFREIQIIANNSYANVVSISDAGMFINPETKKPNYFIVMEHCRGGDVLHEQEKIAQLTKIEKVQLMEERLMGVLEALSEVHRAGFVHGDIKMQNILIQKGVWKLSDFGLANLISEEKTKKNLYGTAAYLAPEYVRGAPRTPGMDWYAVAVMLFEMFTPYQFFSAEPTPEGNFSIINQLAAMYDAGAMGTERESAIRQILEEHLPPETSQVVFQMLQPRPDQRIPDDQVIQVLKAAIRKDKKTLSANAVPAMAS